MLHEICMIVSTVGEKESSSGAFEDMGKTDPKDRRLYDMFFCIRFITPSILPPRLLLPLQRFYGEP